MFKPNGTSSGTRSGSGVRRAHQDKMSTSEVLKKLTPKSPPSTLSFAGTLTSAKFSFERMLGKSGCTDVFGVGPGKNM